jgi:FkbM family methyltransferase
MSFKAFVISHTSYLRSILRYKKTYKNFINVIGCVLLKKYPIKGVLKNGKVISLMNRFEVYTTSISVQNQYRIDANGMITIFLKNRDNIILESDGNYGGSIIEYLINDSYTIPIKGKVVVDIGSFIGDSAIFFSIKGAKQIFSYEPMPRNYEIARKNIERNNLSHLIELHNVACGDIEREILVKEEVKATHQATINSSNRSGTKIPMITLANIVKKIDGDENILKLNCEGCEYQVILKSSTSTLRRFEFMMIEYHYGYKNLEKKLIQDGFDVTIIKPVYCFNEKANKKNMYIGMIYATRK